MTDHGRASRCPQPEGRQRRRRRFAVALAATTATLVAPAAALAADPPTVLSAGIDAQDQLYSSWSVAPGTTFDFVTYGTVPDPRPSLPMFFAGDSFAGFCDFEHPSATCTPSSHVAQFPSPRDRRYYMKVTAAVTGTNDFVTSAVWVIDDAKPQIPGDAPLGAIPPVGPAVAGHPLGTNAPPPVAPPPVAPPPVAPPPVAPPPAAPTASIKALSLPKTFNSLLTKGVRLQVACSVTCSPFGRLTLSGPTLGTKTINMIGGGSRVLTIKPNARGRATLRGRQRARITVTGAVSLTGGATKRYTKSFVVRR